MNDLADQNNPIEVLEEISYSPLYRLSKAALEQTRSISSKNYKNRAEFVKGVHIETRAVDTKDGSVGNIFDLAVVHQENWPHRSLACRAQSVNSYVRYCFSFTLPKCLPGDLILLAWTGRAHGPAAQDIKTQIMVSGLAHTGKFPALPKLIAQEPAEGWNQRHVLFQIAKPTDDKAYHLIFTMASESEMDIADVQVTRLGNRPLGALQQHKAELQLLADMPPLPCRQDPGESPSPGDEDGLIAYIDRDRRVVSGFAWNMVDPLTSVDVEILVNDILVGCISAEPISGDQPIEASLPGRFTYQLPNEVHPGHHVIASRLASNRSPLRGSPVEVDLPLRDEGLLQLSSDGMLHGWAVDRRICPQPATVQIVTKEEGVVAEIVADGQHPVLRGRRYNDGRCAFRLPIPAILRDGRRHSLFARIKDGDLLAGADLPLRIAQDSFLFNVEMHGADRLTGWAVNLAEPDTPVTIEIWLDNKPYGKIRADRPQPSYDDARIGFSMPLPLVARHIEFRIGAGTIAGFDVMRNDGGAVFLSDDQVALPAGRGIDDLDARRRAITAAGGEELFDPLWYCAAYPGVNDALKTGAVASALDHWLTIGCERLWNPNGWFDEAWYRARYEDARNAIKNGAVSSGFLHWLTISDNDWRSPGPSFDPLGFRKTRNADVATARQAVQAWLQTPPLPRETRVVPPIGPRETARISTIMTARRRAGLLYDSFIQRLVEDLTLRDASAGESLKTDLEHNETEIMQWLLDRPVITDQPLVGIIMPTFNRGFVIAEAIQSVIDQSWTNWELIICDDGSTDKTYSVIKAFDDPRIRYFQLEKSNGAIARNVGMRFSTGDYIAFLDSDNLWHPLFLAVCLGQLHHSAHGLIYSGYIDTETAGARFSTATLKFKAFDYQELLRRNFIDLNTICMNRAVYDSLGGFDESLGRVQDWDLVLKYGRLTEPAMAPLNLVFYRRNVAWGQVTDLLAHTDFNAIVGTRALQRLEAAVSILPPTAAIRKLTLVAGSNISSGRELICLADLLSDVAEVRLILPEAETLRRFLSRTGLAQSVTIIWQKVETAWQTLVAGEAIIMAPDVIHNNDLDDADLPLLRLTAEADVTGLAILGHQGQGTSILGGLQIIDIEKKQTTEKSANEGEWLIVVVPYAQQRDWAVELGYHLRGSGKSAVLVGIMPDGEFATHIFENGRELAVSLDERQLLERVQDSAAVLLLAPANTNRLLNISIGGAALAGSVPIWAIDDPAFSVWHQKQLIHIADQIPVPHMIERIAEVASDRKGAETMSRRGLRRFKHLYSRAVMQDRIRVTLAIILDQ